MYGTNLKRISFPNLYGTTVLTKIASYHKYSRIFHNVIFFW